MTDRPTPDYTTSMRSIRCGDLRAADIGTEATLCGWVDSVREHGEHLASSISGTAAASSRSSWTAATNCGPSSSSR